jgi:hypothetical protein
LVLASGRGYTRPYVTSSHLTLDAVGP